MGNGRCGSRQCSGGSLSAEVLVLSKFLSSMHHPLAFSLRTMGKLLCLSWVGRSLPIHKMGATQTSH